MQGTLLGQVAGKDEAGAPAGEPAAPAESVALPEPQAGGRQDAPASGGSAEVKIPSVAAAPGPQVLRQEVSEGRDRWRPMSVAEARVYWRLQVASRIRTVELPAESGVVLRVNLPWREGGEPVLISSSGREDLDQAWLAALAEVLGRVPPPESLQAAGLPVDFEWSR